MIALLSEVAFTKTFNYALLDSVAVGFASVAIHASLSTQRPLLSGLLWGAAPSSKLSTTYPYLGVVVFRVLERRYRDVLVEFAAAAATYVATFTGDVVYSGGGLGCWCRTYCSYRPTCTVSTV